MAEIKIGDIVYHRGCTPGYARRNPIKVNFIKEQSVPIVVDGNESVDRYDIVSEDGWVWYPATGLTKEVDHNAGA